MRNTLSFLMLAGAASQAMADTTAVDLLNPFTAETSNVLLGWTFTTTTDIFVTRLGFVDLEADGMVTSHQLGIFEFATGNLITQATLAAGTASTRIGDFLYVNADGAKLTAGVRYIVVGTDDSDPWTTGPQSNPVFAPEIIPDGGAYFNYGVNTLQVPTDQFVYSQYFGPTFAYSTAVPGPESVAVFGLGALGALRRRRRLSTRKA
jgi:MYXO-CTERM domain-containing protein